MTNRNLITIDKQILHEMDVKADKIIAAWTFGSLVANLLPPPFDYMAVGASFAKMGVSLGEAYEIPISTDALKSIGKAIAKGVAGVAGAAYIGSGFFKYIPGLNLWVALLIQPPIVAKVAYSASKAFKEYYHIKRSGGKDLTPEEMRELAIKALKERLNT